MPDSSLDEDSRCPSNPIVCQPASAVSGPKGIGSVSLVFAVCCRQLVLTLFPAAYWCVHTYILKLRRSKFSQISGVIHEIISMKFLTCIKYVHTYISYIHVSS